MKIFNKEVSVSEAMQMTNLEDILLKRRKEGILLSDYQLNVLEKNGICFDRYNNMRELLFDIEEVLMVEYDEDLDIVGKQLAELIYYKDVNK